MQYVRILFAAASLAACGDTPMNSGDNVVVVVVNSTGLPDIMVTVRGGDTEITANVPAGTRNGLGTGIETAGEPVEFHVEVGSEATDHTCHVHADAIGNPDNVPTAVVYSEPLRIVCLSGWQEEETEALLDSFGTPS
jgi:hypothetical protein